MYQDLTGDACGKPATGSITINAAPKEMFPAAKYTADVSVPLCDRCYEIVRRIREGGRMLTEQ
jgi:hypothetical protein